MSKLKHCIYLGIILVIFSIAGYGESGRQQIESMMPGWANAYIWADVQGVDDWQLLPQCNGCRLVWRKMHTMLSYFGLQNHTGHIYAYGGAPFHSLRMVPKWVAFLHTNYNEQTIRTNLTGQSDIEWGTLTVQGRSIPLGTREFGQVALLPNVLTVSHAFGEGIWGRDGKALPPQRSDMPNLQQILERNAGSMLDQSIMQRCVQSLDSGHQVALVVRFSEGLMQELESFFNRYPFAQGVIRIMRPIRGIGITLHLSPSGIQMEGKFICDSTAAAAQLDDVIKRMKSLIVAAAMMGEERAARLQRYLSHFTHTQEGDVEQLQLEMDATSLHLVSDIIVFADQYSMR